MARLSAFFLVFLLGAVSAVALVACGSGDEADLLPGTTADQIESNLDEVEQLADAEDCIGAEGAVAEVSAEVEELQGIDQKLKAALQEGTRKLSEVVSHCEEEESSEETEPSPEADVEADEVEDDEKPKKQEKPGKEAEEPAEQTDAPNAEEGFELPPQANGKGEEEAGGESAPPVAPEPEAVPPSGGVGPNTGVE